MNNDLYSLKFLRGFHKGSDIEYKINLINFNTFSYKI